jgi:hypothetical protein
MHDPQKQGQLVASRVRATCTLQLQATPATLDLNALLAEAREVSKCFSNSIHDTFVCLDVTRMFPPRTFTDFVIDNPE